MARTEVVTARVPSTRVVLGILLLTVAWAMVVVIFPDVGFPGSGPLTLLVFLPGAVAVAWAVRAWRCPASAGPGTRLALLLVPTLVLATTAAVVLDDGYRDTLRWRLSRGAFEAGAADLATSTPEVGTFHGARLVGLVWVGLIEVYGQDVMFHLPGYLDNAVIAYDPTGSGREQFGPGTPLGGDWYRYWFHF
jgi:hypothetical protein